MKYQFIAWKESGIWTAHSPSVPGVYGMGRTLESATNDLSDGLDELIDYMAEVGEAPPEPIPMRTGRVSV